MTLHGAIVDRSNMQRWVRAMFPNIEIEVIECTKRANLVCTFAHCGIFLMRLQEQGVTDTVEVNPAMVLIYRLCFSWTIHAFC
jgi:hypothetical protein